MMNGPEIMESECKAAALYAKLYFILYNMYE
jgi:hypothetical protein